MDSPCSPGPDVGIATVANYTDTSVAQIRMEMCSSGY